ncbi:MAG: pentapeptide repeat-containing protein [Cyanobacteria bacterium P01_H01_bin.150]
MTSPNLKGRRKQKITYTASVEGIKTAEKALKRLGFESKSNFSKSQLISRSTVTKFFQRQPIQLDSFKRICEGLKLNNWKEIAELEPSKTIDCNRTAINEGGKVEMTNCRQIIVIDKESKIVKAQIILEGDINSVNNDLRLTLELCLRKYPEDDIRITNIESGSIKLTIEGFQESVQKLVELIKSGELIEVNGFPIKGIQILTESLDEGESNETSSDDKWSLIQEIVAQPVEGRKLSGADLSDADLSGADLSGADLRNSDFSDADLSGTDLSGADLSGADLTGANLRNTIIDSDTKLDIKWLFIWEIFNRKNRKRTFIGVDP